MAEKTTVDVLAIEASAEVRQVKSMVDGSINVVLNLPEPFKPQGKFFMDWVGKMVRIVVVGED